ncbi:hypothetical protein GCM10009111_35050 [Colwellia asteriadis]|uniref:Uncharacterized protein n=1 Tax=Colwellia asteriadis TaxID=517723 RepID=A0ABN1LBJ1_9GAMM
MTCIAVALNTGVKGIAEELQLNAEIKQIHNDSNGSAGARTIADIATNKGIKLSRYRAVG